MGDIIAAPSFSKLDKNFPQSAEPVEESKIEKKILAPTSGLKFANKKPSISPSALQGRPQHNIPSIIEEEKEPNGNEI